MSAEPLTLWRCERCARAVRSLEAPLCCGQRAKALAVEMAPETKKRRCCLGARRQGL